MCKSFSSTPYQEFRCFYSCAIFLSHKPVQALGKDKNEHLHAGKTLIRDVIVMLK